MRALLPAVAAVALFTLSIPLASAEEDPEWACHDWEVVVGDPTANGVAASPDDGALYLALFVEGVNHVYVVSDHAPGHDGGLFSIWIATETNGEPGYQRGEPCDDTPPGTHPDCFLSCTF